MSEEKFVDEAWKNSVDQEKNKNEGVIITPDSFDKDKQVESSHEETDQEACCGEHESCEHEQQGLGEINFSGYLTSLAYQALIFMGEIPHPMTNQTEKNYDQSKLIIDTLAMLREKTKVQVPAKCNAPPMAFDRNSNRNAGNNR